MEVKEIYTGPLFVKTWVFMLDGRLILVDPGGCDEELLDYINELSPSSLEVMLTHGHFDHIGGLPYLFEHYNITHIYIHKKDAFYLGDGAKKNHIKCFSPIRAERYIQNMKEEFPAPTDYIKEGDEINSFRVLETPGHTEGSVCFYNESEGILFSGDTLFRRSRGRTDLLEGDEKKIILSLKKLLIIKDEVVVYPGHGANTVMKEEKPWIEAL